VELGGNMDLLNSLLGGYAGVICAGIMFIYAGVL